MEIDYNLFTLKTLREIKTKTYDLIGKLEDYEF